MTKPLNGQEIPFPQTEYRERIKTVQTDLTQKKLAGGILFDPENIYWLTGFQTIGYFTFQCLLVLPDRDPILISRKVNGFLASVTPTFSQFIGIADDELPVDKLTAALNEHFTRNDSIGLETRAWYLTVRDYQELTSMCSYQFVDWNDHIEPYRCIKSKAQLDRMRSAARAAEAGLDAALKVVRVGANENVLAAAMHSASISAGGEYLGHPPLVVSGERTALCFAMWKRRELKQGDVVLLESAGCIDRYHAMIARALLY